MTELRAIRFPRGLKTGVFCGLKCNRFAQRLHPTVCHFGERKPSVGAADVDRNNLH